jgi:ceramide glucosyltransferase
MELYQTQPFLQLATAIGVISLVYLGFALYCLHRRLPRLTRSFAEHDSLPSVSILKPICGNDPELLENLRSFCAQDYPRFQIIIGIRDHDDPARAIVEQLLAEHPAHDIQLIINDRLWGSNYKVSNLINLYPAAKHDVFLVADSDMRVQPDYLRRVVGVFRDHRVGAATCLYYGTPLSGMISRLGSLYVNEWFLPSALVAGAIGRLRYCFGATMAVRRDALEAIGGFHALANFLADDYMLGRLLSDRGYRIALAPYVVENIIEEPGLRSLLLHELRWARTMRTVQPWGYGLSWITDTVPVTMLSGLAIDTLDGPLVLACSLPLTALLVRLWQHKATARLLGTANGSGLLELLIRDWLTLLVRLFSYTGRSVHWRRHDFSVNSAGQLGTGESPTLALEKLAVNED